MAKFDPIIQVVDDGLVIPEIGSWGLLKYNLVGAYCNIFASSMKNKWDRLVYIDLFAGAGYAKIKNDNKIIQTSSLIAMNIPYPFTDYIVSEFDEDKLDALKARIEKHHPHKRVSYYLGDTNKNIVNIAEEVRKISEYHKTLCFCFVDPFSLNLHFNTIKTLSKFNIDFLILLAIHMDFNRNVTAYFNENNTKVELFTDNKSWRTDLEKSPDKQNIVNFLSVQYDKNMVSLGYQSPVDKQKIASFQQNIPKYHLAFYSRHPLGNDFFQKIKHYAQNLQLNLPF